MLICRFAFLSPPTSFHNKPIVMLEVAYPIVIKDIINKALITQSMLKAL